jgi:hypothetical protein
VIRYRALVPAWRQCRDHNQDCQIFLGTKYQNGRILPNNHKIYPKFMKYTKIFHYMSLQNLPKLGFFVWKYAIWQPWSQLRIFRLKQINVDESMGHNLVPYKRVEVMEILVLHKTSMFM